MPYDTSLIWNRLRRAVVAGSFALYLQLAAPRLVGAEDHIAYKWQTYQEDDGRIRVISSYLGVAKQLTDSLSLRAHGVHDAISGASPTGESAGEGEALPVATIEDTRRAGVVDIDWIRGVHKTSFQFAYSKESDYLSRGYAVYNTSEFNKRNTGVSYGVSFTDDEIEPAFFSESRSKQSVDAYVGLSQVVDPTTVVRCNISYGTADGYLNDPYKIIRKDVEVLPGLYLPLSYVESRPDERKRRILFLGARRYFEKAKGSLDVGYRVFEDSWSIESDTFELEWSQKLGERLIARPSYRYYRQSAASFYLADLTGTDIDPDAIEPSSGPYFSADYRLARFDAETIGLKLVYSVTESIKLDVSWARYVMRGKDGVTREDAFPKASTTTIGGSWWF